MPAVLVSIIGPPAAGKTTLAEGLAARLPARLAREDYAGNPFLEPSYLGRRDLALAAQLYFLYSRLMQLNRTTWPADGWVVSDYAFSQDVIYAVTNLPRRDLRVYFRLAEPIGGMVRPPDVLIALAAPAGVLLERIARRGRRHERAFTAEFLDGMSRAYQDVVAAAACPVITVDAAAVDVRQGKQQARLAAAVRAAVS